MSETKKAILKLDKHDLLYMLVQLEKQGGYFLSVPIEVTQVTKKDTLAYVESSFGIGLVSSFDFIDLQVVKSIKNECLSLYDGQKFTQELLQNT